MYYTPNCLESNIVYMISSSLTHCAKIYLNVSQRIIMLVTQLVTYVVPDIE